MGAARWTYNQCLSAIKDLNVAKKMKDLRAHCINKEALGEGHWALDIPYDIRDEGMRDLLKAYKSCFAKKEAFIMRYKSKKCPDETMVINKKHIHKTTERNKFHCFTRTFGAIETAEPVPEITHDIRIQRTHLNEFFLVIPRVKAIRRSETQTVAGSVVALDPGVRVFNTCYDPDGVAVEVGSGDVGRIYRLCHVIDKLQKEWSAPTTRANKRYKLKKAAKQIRKKIKNLIRDIHHKLARFLCDNYEFILLPKFDTQQMVMRGKRRINSKTARSMVTWSHYTFRQRLMDKAKEYDSPRTVVMCNEHYTSKTCGNCGFLHKKLGGNKTFKCPQCGVVMGRDLNGARNILLRYASGLGHLA